MKDIKKNCEITEEEKLNYEVKKIEFIIQEIKDTERRFSESIHEVIKFLLVPARIRNDIFTNEHIHSIFCNIEELEEIQMTFQKELSQASDISALSSCFCYWLPILSPIFEKYCCNFENAIKLLQQKDKTIVPIRNNGRYDRKRKTKSRLKNLETKSTNSISTMGSSDSSSSSSSIESDGSDHETTLQSRLSSFNWLNWCNSKHALFLEGCRVKGNMRNLPVCAFLLEPVQRITRYPLLLKVLRDELETSPDYDEKVLDLGQLNVVIVLAEQIARLVNETNNNNTTSGTNTKSPSINSKDVNPKFGINLVRSAVKMFESAVFARN